MRAADDEADEAGEIEESDTVTSIEAIHRQDS
jgi:hypothetical protein